MSRTAPVDLAADEAIDLAAVELDYEGFRKLAVNPHLGVQERIGFPAAYRDGFEAAILDDILTKLPRLRDDEGLTVVDVGPGCAGLPRRLIELCRQRRHRLVLADSDEMLAQLPDVAGVTFKQPGLFPHSAPALAALAGPADAVLCYSVLHYIVLDADPLDFVDALVGLMAPGARALVGDIPNHSKRRRFFSSDAGQAFHRAFTGSDDPYVAHLAPPPPGVLDDASIAALVRRAQDAGCDAYLTPQAPGLPMANRRDDLLIARP